MGLRFLGALIAGALLVFAALRYRKRLLTRAEFLMIFPLVVVLVAIAAVPEVFDIPLRPLGLQPGNQRRLIGVLVLAVVFLLLLILWAFTKIGSLSREVANHVDRATLRRFEQEYSGGLRGTCAVIIPAFNEAKNLPAVLRAIPTTIRGMPVQPVVVADGCTDGTEAVARDMGALVMERDVRRGQGASVRLGYLAGLRQGARLIVTMDGDGQHDPKEMDALVEPLINGSAEMVQGSRVLGSSAVQSLARRRGVKLFAYVLTRLSKTKITDPSNGYRAVLPNVLRKLELRQDQFFVSELVVDALQKRLRLIEVPVTVYERGNGTSRKGGTLRYGWGFARTIGITWLRQRVGKPPAEFEPRWLAHQTED